MGKRMGEYVEIPKIDYFHLAQYRGMYPIRHHIWTSELLITGLFLIGLGVSVARTSLTNAIFFSCFEYFKKKINEFPRPDRDRID